LVKIKLKYKKYKNWGKYWKSGKNSKIGKMCLGKLHSGKSLSEKTDIPI